MLIDVIMPQLGESVTEGTVTKWLVHEGDTVAKDQPLLEIATDKADSELPAPAPGKIAKILVREGDVVLVKALLCQIEEGLSQSDVVPAGTRSAQVAQSGGAPMQTASTPSPSRSVVGSALASPGARKAALELAVNLDDVHGSGDFGRITKDDVLRAKAQPAPATSQASTLAQMINDGGGFVRNGSAPASGGAVPLPGFGYGTFKVPSYRKTEGDRVVPFTRRRRITADHMTYSKFASPHVVTVAEVDLFRSSRMREANKERYKKEGLSLTMLAFVTVAVARALRENETLNARVLDDAYVVFKDINIGVAVDSPDGLVVPVVRRADELGLRGIVRAIDDLAGRARAGKITIDDLSSATFSISNPGIRGNLFGAAIINQPNVGILRMGEIQKRVVVVDGPDGDDQMAIHPIMYVALSYDHRIVDGVAANSFLWRVTELLEKADFEV